MEKQSFWVFFTRGAQFILHDLRLGVPILEKLLGFSVVLFLAVWFALIAHITSPYERYVVGQYTVAHIIICTPKFRQEKRIDFVFCGRIGCLIRGR